MGWENDKECSNFSERIDGAVNMSQSQCKNMCDNSENCNYAMYKGGTWSSCYLFDNNCTKTYSTDRTLYTKDNWDPDTYCERTDQLTTFENKTKDECKYLCDSSQTCKCATYYNTRSRCVLDVELTKHDSQHNDDLGKFDSYIKHRQYPGNEWQSEQSCHAEGTTINSFTNVQACTRDCIGNDECTHAVFVDNYDNQETDVCETRSGICNTTNNDGNNYYLYAKNIDCSGTWGDCSADCSRTWTEIVAQSGNGAGCPTMPACTAGEDECPADIDCSGTWSECNTDCSRTWTQIAAQSGNGAGCPLAPACAAGEDECPADIDCSGTWSECNTDCSRTWTQIAAQSGNGAGCPLAPACAAGEDECPASNTSSEGEDEDKSDNASLIIGLSIGGGVLFVIFAFMFIMFRGARKSTGGGRFIK